MKPNIKAWLKAFRIRTLPLSLSCIAMGSFVAYFHFSFNWIIFILSFSTTIFLQILSNLANDYGDSIYGADNAMRQGPQRATQSGIISQSSMKRMIWVFAGLSFVSGLFLLFFSKLSLTVFIVFLILGIIAIAASINYTISVKKPYGYKGLGDLSVYLFFGLLAVYGAYFLQIGYLDLKLFLLASTCGFFATGVLNINNIRDMESDRIAGKNSIPLRIGVKNAVIYHGVLLFGGFLLTTVWVILNFYSSYQFLYLLTFPLFLRNFQAVLTIGSSALLDSYLKQLSISILLFVLFFGAGIVIVLYQIQHF
jgi:1,4-dihydroxy-2-naphthoate octaprenyltransferase